MFRKGHGILQQYPKRCTSTLHFLAFRLFRVIHKYFHYSYTNFQIHKKQHIPMSAHRNQHLLSYVFLTLAILICIKLHPNNV